MAKKVIKKKQKVSKTPEVKKTPPRRTEFVYHDPGRRFTVAGRVVIEKGSSKTKTKTQKFLNFGVAVTKRQDPWSKADDYKPSVGRIKAEGQAKSKNPFRSLLLEPTDNPERLFLTYAIKAGQERVDEVEEKLMLEEQKFELGKRLSEALDFYYDKLNGTRSFRFGGR